MKKLLQFELYKLKKQKSLYICSAVIVALLFLAVLANYILTKTLGEYTEMASPSAVDIVISAVSASDFMVVASIFIVLYVCGDYNQKTIKNIYSRGFSRTGVYFAKLIICTAYIVIMYIIVELFALAFGCAFFGLEPSEGHIFWSLFGQLFVCLAYAYLVFAICNMVKKTGIAFAIVLVAPAVLTSLLTVLDIIIQVNLGDSLSADTFMFSNFWLPGMLTTLATTASSVSKIVVSCVLPFVYGGLFVTVGYLVNRKTEV